MRVMAEVLSKGSGRRRRRWQACWRRCQGCSCCCCRDAGLAPRWKWRWRCGKSRGVRQMLRGKNALRWVDMFRVGETDGKKVGGG